MSAITGTIQGIHGINSPKGDFSANASGVPVLCAYVDFTITGTYAQGGGNQAQLTGVPTALQSFLHNGKTITLLQAAFAAPGDESGTPIGTGLCTVSGTNITFPLTGGDLVTEHAAGALATTSNSIPLTLFICFTEQ